MHKMRHFLFATVLTLGISASADLQRFAIVQGTNVLHWTQWDTLKPPALKPGTTNVAITEAEAAVIKPGWTLVNGEFRDPKGAAISNGTKARIDRAKLIDAAIA